MVTHEKNVVEMRLLTASISLTFWNSERHNGHSDGEDTENRKMHFDMIDVLEMMLVANVILCIKSLDL